MIEKELTLIIRQGCIYCDMALNLLNERQLNYKLLILDRDFTRPEFQKMVPNAKTFPQVIIDGKSIGGYEELTILIDDLI